MSGLYMTGMLDWLRRAGCKVAENSITAGWQTRARSSGGFPIMPLGVQWHHTASATSPTNDLNWMVNGSDDAPIGNLLLDRTGTFWPVAAGAANTAGKGGPMPLSRGTIPMDQGNTQSIAIEVANNGVGEAWPQVQIDAYFAGSNALNAMCGNKPSDVFTHAKGAGNGWTDRKIDPATAAAVQGPWKPRSTNSSGTWHLDDVRAECVRRASIPEFPPQQPPIIVRTPMDYLNPPHRVYDSRQEASGAMRPTETRRIDLKHACVAAIINITSVGPQGTGFMSVWGAGARPNASVLNMTAGENVCNAITLATDSNGSVQLYSSVGTHVIVDVYGFQPPEVTPS